MRTRIKKKIETARARIPPEGYGIGRTKLIDLKPPRRCTDCKSRMVEIKIEKLGRKHYKFVCKNKNCNSYSQSTQVITHTTQNKQIHSILSEIFHKETD